MKNVTSKMKVMTAAGLMLAANNAMAAQTGTEFQGIATKIQGWTEGYLGLTLALAAFLIGLAVGLVKQTVLPAIIGIGVALFAVFGPGIIASFFTGVI